MVELSLNTAIIEVVILLVPFSSAKFYPLLGLTVPLTDYRRSSTCVGWPEHASWRQVDTDDWNLKGTQVRCISFYHSKLLHAHKNQEDTQICADVIVSSTQIGVVALAAAYMATWHTERKGGSGDSHNCL